MKQGFGGFVGARCCSVSLLILILSTAVLSAGVTAAQNKKKKNSDTSNPAAPAPPLPAADQIERNIGRMLVAFQFGDADEMHKYYSDSATFVRSGVYEAPIIGWASYAEEYKRSWPAFQGMQITRRNTIIFTRPDVSWATYQWEFNSTVNGKPFTANGQTTLVFNKVGDNWVIVHNHTSQICPAAAATPAQSPAGTQPPSAPQPPGL
jgi:ketosteroid isomerase-like protein